jgi:biotin transport system substrate-specific component
MFFLKVQTLERKEVAVIRKLLAREVTMAAVFAALTAVGAFLSIPLPFSPVPVTLQTFFTYLAGAVLGSYLGALSQIIYLVLGGIGLPIFAGGKAGFGVLMGPTGGYLIGFIVGAFVIGKLVKIKGNPSFGWTLFSMSIGTLVIYLLGVIQLSVWVEGIHNALIVGVSPFLPGDSLKILLAASIAVKVRRILKVYTTNQIKNCFFLSRRGLASRNEPS